MNKHIQHVLNKDQSMGNIGLTMLGILLALSGIMLVVVIAAL
jgi:hypothetical protein